MPGINVNPTRQELTRLKHRLRTCVRGHKLLKDKRDELMKQFMDTVRENRALRAKVEEGLMQAHNAFTVAAALMSSEAMEQALLYPKQAVALDMGVANIMSVNVPTYQFRTRNDDPGEISPYGRHLRGAGHRRRRPGPGVPGHAQAGPDGKGRPALVRRNPKDPPPGECLGVRQNPPDGGGHQVYHHEAGRK